MTAIEHIAYSCHHSEMKKTFLSVIRIQDAMARIKQNEIRKFNATGSNFRKYTTGVATAVKIMA
jgi:hypothetical protein